MKAEKANSLAEEIKKVIYQNYDGIIDWSPIESLAKAAIGNGIITEEEYKNLRIQKRKQQKEEIRQQILKTLKANSSIADRFLQIIKQTEISYKDFDIPLNNYYPDYASNYYDDHPGNSIYNNDGYPFTIADAIIDGAIDLDSLKKIALAIDVKNE